MGGRRRYPGAGRRASRAEWLELAGKYEQSGESTAIFCARHRLSSRTFSWWRWQLRDERERSPAAESVRLVAVDVAPRPEQAHSAGWVRVAVGDVDVQVPVGADVEYVGALVGALRRRC